MKIFIILIALLFSIYSNSNPMLGSELVYDSSYISSVAPIDSSIGTIGTSLGSSSASPFAPFVASSGISCDLLHSIFSSFYSMFVKVCKKTII